MTPFRVCGLVAALSLAACGKNPGAYKTAEVVSTAEADMVALTAEADALWELRVDPDQLAKAIAAYEAIIKVDPRNRHALTRLVRGWYFYGDSHTTDKDTKIERWATAITYGKQCLALNEEFASRLQAGEKEADAVSSTTIDDAPCMYWTASAIGKWGKIQGIAKALGNLPTVKAYIGRVEELDADYYFYGPARYWGTYYSVLPSFAGRDFDQSATYFEASLAGAPGYLPTYGLRAENLAVGTGNVEMFYKDLQYILDFDASSVPEVIPENTLEKIKAKALLEKAGELFDKKTLEAYQAATPN
jgi:tetratricopeptide (TPR) repeat protein